MRSQGFSRRTGAGFKTGFYLIHSGIEQRSGSRISPLRLKGQGPFQRRRQRLPPSLKIVAAFKLDVFYRVALAEQYIAEPAHAFNLRHNLENIFPVTHILVNLACAYIQIKFGWNTPWQAPKLFHQPTVIRPERT